MKIYRCQIKEFCNIPSGEFDGVKYRMTIEVVPEEKIDKPDEKQHRKIYQIDVSCTDILQQTWGLSDNDLKIDLCEYARRHFVEKLSEGTCSEFIVLNLGTGNSPKCCPYDPSKIQCYPGHTFQVEISKKIGFK